MVLSNLNCRRATNLFSSLDDALEFMDDYGFDTARATLLEGIGRIAEAAELHLAEGRTIIAIRLFIQDSQNAASKQRAEECLLEGLWKHLSFSLVPRPGLDISDSPLGELLTLSNQMRDAGGSLSMKAQDEVSQKYSEVASFSLKELQVLMFQNIASGQLLRLQGLGEKFHNSHQDSAATVLCLDHAFSKPLKTHIMSHFELASFLQTFALYTGELKKIVLDADPSHSTSLQRLFGFEILEDSKDNVAIGSGTFLHDFVSQRRRMAPDLNGRYILGNREFITLFKEALRSRLKDRVNGENLACREAPALFPCLSFTVFGGCNSPTCNGAHLDSYSLDSEWYHTRIQILLQQMLIYQTISQVEHRSIVLAQRRYVYLPLR